MITRLRYSVGGAQDQYGTVAPYLNVGGYDWRTNTPDRPDSLAEKKWPIWAEYKNGPLIVWYWDGAYRSSSGGKWGIPTRWFYGRREEEVWNPSKQQWEINGLYYTAPPAVDPVVKPTPKSLRYIIDGLKMRYTTGELNQAIDESQYNEPSEGAPEDGNGAPLEPGVPQV
jgi:hypothetical protein